MNKKVLTLCAGFLLAGGMLSSVNAISLKEAAENPGKYYKIARLAYKESKDAAWEESVRFVTITDKKSAVADELTADSYWTVSGNDKDGYILTNLNGVELSVESTSSFGEYLTDAVESSDTEFQLMLNNSTYVGVAQDLTLTTRQTATYDPAASVFDVMPTNLEKATKGSNSLATDKETTFKFVVGSSTIEDGNIYKATYDKDNNSFSFIDNETGAALLIGGEKDFVVVTCEDGAYLQLPSEGKYVAYADGAFKLVDSLEEATLFGFQETSSINVYVRQLNYFEKDGFSMTITCAKDADGEFNDALAGDVFKGHLTPRSYSNNQFADAADFEQSFYLQNADGNYIVAEKWGGVGDNEEEAIYSFTTVSEDVLKLNLQRAEAGLEAQKYFGLFGAEASESQLDKDEKGLTELTRLYLFIPDAEDADSYWPAALGRYDYSGTPTLAASKEWGTKLMPIKIKLGSSEVVKVGDFILPGEFVTVVRNNVSETSKAKEGFVVADGVKTLNSTIAAKMSATDIVGSYGNPLEGQWAVTMNADRTEYVFTNRENTNVYFTLHAGSLYVTDAERVYRQGDYTYEIKSVPEHDAADGYKRLTDLKNTKFHIAYSVGVLDGTNVYFTENHEGVTNHTIGLDADVADALTFSAKEYNKYQGSDESVKLSSDGYSYEYIPTDTIFVISKLGKLKDGKYDGESADTLKVLSYSFVNQWNEPLVYSPKGNKYESVANKYSNVEDAHGAAQKFALREDGEKLNLRLVELANPVVPETEYNAATSKLYQEFTYSSYRKVYSGDAANGILANETLYDRTENDLFVVEETEKPMYRRVVSPLDTVSIFRDGNNQSVLFESKGFLGMENLSQFPDIAPGMIADTAYIGNGDITYYRPQYLLAVDAIQHGPTTWCPDHGYGATCQHAIDIKGYLEGRFLVNLKDTAIAWDEANKHKDGNPYINSENFYRLGFVQATHRNDSLIIANDNNRIYVGDENYNVAKFAFRYVDDAAGSFVIETADYVTLPGAKAGEMKPTYGYLKWMNNVVVVVNDIKNADVYNMNEAFEGNPTANEEISANTAVSVVATDGAVIVKGAEGKNVVVSTILGKVVANEVLNSDNETIAAPAGIVVVSVDGESFKVAVK